MRTDERVLDGRRATAADWELISALQLLTVILATGATESGYSIGLAIALRSSNLQPSNAARSVAVNTFLDQFGALFGPRMVRSARRPFEKMF